VPRVRGEISNPSPLVRRVFERSRELGLSDRELARRSGYNISTVYYWRTRVPGVNADPFVMLADLAATVGLELVLREPETTTGGSSPDLSDAV
jgi:hypothetical protein